MLPGCRGMYPSKCGVTRVTGVTKIGKLLYLLDIFNVTSASYSYLQECNSAIWCNASGARKRDGGFVQVQETRYFPLPVCPMDTNNGL